MKNIAKSIGKTFEENWRKSIPKEVLYYRPRDSAQSFGKSQNLRFSAKSPCDCFLFNGEVFYALELKSFQGSCSFEREKTDKGIIHYHQIESLKNFSTYKNVISGFLLDFRKTDNTYFLLIDDFCEMLNHITKKSFNENDMFEWCNPIKINKTKLKVNYRYDVINFLYDTKL